MSALEGPRTAVEDLRSWTVAVGASAQIQPSTTATQGRPYEETGVSVLVQRMQPHALLFKCLIHAIVVANVGLLKSKKPSQCQAVPEQHQGLQHQEHRVVVVVVLVVLLGVVVVVRETH